MPAPATTPRSRKPLWIAAGLVALTVAGVGAWRWPRRDATAGRPLMLLVSGDTSGWIVPCGCTSNQSGGLLRRGTHVRRLQEQAHVLVADAGGAPAGTSEYQRLKFEAILRGELALGLVAHNLGTAEAALGADYLRRTAAELGVPFVSANLRDAEGRLVAAPLRIVEAAGRRIGFTGVLGRQTIAGVQIDEPREALLRVLEEVRGRCDSLVVLAYLPEEELRSLAAALPEADAIVGGPTGQSIPPQQVGPALLAAATNKGKYLIELTAGPRGAVPAWSGRVAEMGKELTDDAGQQENLRRYLADLERRDLRAADTGLAMSLAQAEQRLAGTASCRSCHQADCSAWDKSGHAHAWDSLVKDGYQGDPYCQQCHTTGYGLPGGFDSMTRTPLARDVGCESCHGPAAAHARSPQTPTPLRARSQCQRCHDVENSPQFDYAGYWPRIRHGQPSREAPSP